MCECVFFVNQCVVCLAQYLGSAGVRAGLQRGNEPQAASPVMSAVDRLHLGLQKPGGWRSATYVETKKHLNYYRTCMGLKLECNAMPKAFLKTYRMQNNTRAAS